MHEFSVVEALINQCEQIARDNSKGKITKVSVKIGILSGVEVELFKRAFETFKEDSLCKGAKLEVQIQNIQILCKTCNKTSLIDKHTLVCPACSSSDLILQDGDEMYLMQLELDD